METKKALTNRWSPRAFSEKEISPGVIEELLNAARGAPSSMNEQPWFYYYSYRGEQGFEKMLECLAPANRIWASSAAALLLSVSVRNFTYGNKPNRHSLHDTGAANVLLALQATDSGLQAHQMGGFDMARTIETFKLNPTEYEPATFIALGYEGNPENLPPDLRERETAERHRKSTEEISAHFK